MACRGWFGQALLIVIFGAFVIGCEKGSAARSGRGAGSREPIAPSAVGGMHGSDGYQMGDEDSDEDAINHYDDAGVRNFGQFAAGEESQKLSTVVRRYFTAAASRNGRRACSLLAASLVRTGDIGEKAEEVFPLKPDAPPLRGKKCGYVMSLLFDEDHQRLLAESSAMVVTAVRVRGDNARVLLGYKQFGERQMPVVREDREWRIGALLSQEIP